MIKTKTIYFISFLILLIASVVSVNKSFEMKTVSLAKAQKSLTIIGKILSAQKDDIFIARTVLMSKITISTAEPIEVYGHKFDLDTTPTIDLIAKYREIRSVPILKEHKVNNIPSVIVTKNKSHKIDNSHLEPIKTISNLTDTKYQQTKKIIAKISTQTQKPLLDLAPYFTDLKRLEKDLILDQDLTKKIALAENTETGKDFYSLKAKPFSKYISRGVPGLKVDSQKSRIKTIKKDTYVLKPTIVLPEAVQVVSSQNSGLKKNEKIDRQPENRKLNSQDLLDAITQVQENKINNNKDQAKEQAVVVDMGRGQAKVVKTTNTDNSLFGEISTSKTSSCVEPYLISNNLQTYKSTLRIAADSFIINQGFKNDVKDFNLDFSDSYNDINYESKGSIVLEQKIANKFSIRRGTIYKEYHYPTVVDFVFENEDLTLNVPLVDISSMGTILSQYTNIQYDSHALIELDEKTEDVSIIGKGSEYSHKIYLNYNLKVVKPGNSDYVYILFINVKPGNYFLEYKTSKGNLTNKIVHIEQEKVYFDSNYYVNEKSDQFALYENDLLTKCAYEVDVASDQLINIADQVYSNKLNINNYKFENIIYPLGTRKYYELKYENSSIFIGRQESKRVVIPSSDYVNYLYEQFNISSLRGMCIIQLNLNKKAENIKVNMTSPNYNFDFDMLVLDQDGLFYRDFTANTNRVFILGTEQGVANIKLDYIDGSVEYLQSYCSDSTYLVEEL